MSRPSFLRAPAVVLLGLALSLPLLAAEPLDTARKATEATGKGLSKAEEAVKETGKRTSEGIQRGMKRANRGADQAARKLGIPPGKPASGGPTPLAEAKKQ